MKEGHLPWVNPNRQWHLSPERAEGFTFASVSCIIITNITNNTDYFPGARSRSKCFIHQLIYSSPYSVWEVLLWSPFCIWEIWGSERLSHSPKVAQLGRSGADIKTQAVSLSLILHLQSSKLPRAQPVDKTGAVGSFAHFCRVRTLTYWWKSGCYSRDPVIPWISSDCHWVSRVPRLETKVNSKGRPGLCKE